jgi:branched-chain amino acid transport system ATP-binding protein
VNTFYGAVQVHFDLSLEVARGRIVSLLGGNASGKSTTMKVILGLVTPRSGTVTLDGAPINGLPTHQIIRAGVGSVPEARRIFPLMTVRENLTMGAYVRNDRRAIAEDLARMLELFPRVAERLDQRAGTLSGGEQQMVAIARGLMSDPEILIIDELSLGLAPVVVYQLLATLKKLKEAGLTILLVEQNVHLALALSDYAYVVAGGRIFTEGLPAELAAKPEIRRAYLGL